MSYDSLARYYDALVKDEEATVAWVDFTEKYCTGKKILELACGSGEISIALAEKGYEVDATDLSAQMIAQAQAKSHPDNITFRVMDMLEMDCNEPKDAILCYCDSLNYLSGISQVEQLINSCAEHLRPQGVFLFDMHTPDRLEEFADEYIEEGLLDGTAYQWTIQSDEDKVYQHFAFWTEQGILQEHHVQTVFDCEQVEQLMAKAGFETEIYTDFTQPGKHPGEKYFIVGRKK